MSKGLSSLHKKLLFKPIPPEMLALTFFGYNSKSDDSSLSPREVDCTNFSHLVQILAQM